MQTTNQGGVSQDQYPNPGKAPKGSHKGTPPQQTLKKQMTEETDQHHGESTKAPQDDRNIGQHNGAGRPPLMKK